MRSLFTKLSICALTALTLSAQNIAMAQTESVQNVVYKQDGTLADQVHVPTYEWYAEQTPSRGVVLAVHGVTMHGKSFDYLGKTLAQQGYHVVALDMRGYGRSFFDEKGEALAKAQTRAAADNRAKVNYDKSFDDVVKVARALRTRFPGQPVFGLGESLGTNMVLHLAAEHPDLVDGLILSAPSVRRHQMIDPFLIVNAGMFCANPRAQLDLMPFVRKYASDDIRVVQGMETDPLMRHRMSFAELLRATKAIRHTISYVPKINADTPVLIIQGGNDRVLHAEAVTTLLAKLPSKDQTVKWFAERGHILLETEYIKPDTMDAVVSWLNTHVESREMQSKLQSTDQYVAAVDANGFEHASFRAKVGDE